MKKIILKAGAVLCFCLLFTASFGAEIVATCCVNDDTVTNGNKGSCVKNGTHGTICKRLGQGTEKCTYTKFNCIFARD